MTKVALVSVVVVLAVAIQGPPHSHSSTIPTTATTKRKQTLANHHDDNELPNPKKTNGRDDNSPDGICAPTSFDDIVDAAKVGNWDQFQALLNANFGGQPSWRTLDFHNIRNLKPPQGGNVYGEAEYTFHSSSNFNGRQAEESGGHKIINDNGKVNEFDFKP